MTKGFTKILIAAAVAVSSAAFTPATAQSAPQKAAVPSAEVLEKLPKEILNMSIAELEDAQKDQPKVVNYVERDLPSYVADELYGTWNSLFLTPTSIPNDRLPEQFNIDLTGFEFPHHGRITSGFGVRSKYRNHYGVDISARVGDPIRAAYSGKVRIAGYDKGGFGYYVVVRHHNGLETIYGHLGRNLVKRGQEVKAGQVIGKAGLTGRMAGCVLHFEMRFLGTPFNPQRFFDFKEKRLIAENFTYTTDMHNVKPRVSKYRSSNV